MVTVPDGQALAADLLARCTFPPPGTAVNCAVSGGADSLALLVLAVRAGCEVTAVHVDHGLRPGSDDEAEVVRDVAERLGAAFLARRADVGPGPNLEARARRARYAVLPADAMLGHTADDQVETMLLNLLRGAGPEGMSGMQPGRRRPILGLRRRETEQLCAAHGLRPIDDPTNVDPSFRRNRVRHELLPLLDDIAGRDVVPVIARQAPLFRAVVDHLACEAAALDPTDARRLATAPVAVARVAVREWLRRCSDDGHPPDAATVDRVLAVAGGTAVATDAGGGWRVERHAQQLSLHRAPPDRHG
jgi:tRNA(Ile)-lysidine synthase